MLSLARMCSCTYRVFHDCTIQSVSALPRARLCLTLYRVFQDGHAYKEFCVSTSKTVFILTQSVPVMSMHTKFCSVAVLPRERLFAEIYTQCSTIVSVGKVLQYGQVQEYVFMYIQIVL